jgi:Methyltransferase domain
MLKENIMSFRYKFNKYKRLAFKLPRQLMQIDVIRNLFCFLRWSFLQRRMEVLPGADNDPKIYKNTVKFNLLGAKDLDGERTHQLIRPIVGIERILRTQNKLKVLSIGPRTEAEIFNLWAYGFSLKNITGLDLISYSKYIQVGDMHNMPLNDSSFDLIVAGWVLVYSHAPEIAAREIIRVAKDQAIIAVTASYNNRSSEEIIQRYGSLDTKRFDNLEYIKEVFKNHIDFVYFQQDVDPLLKQDIASPTLIFRIKK